MTKYLRTHLHIFQLESYSIFRFLSWWFHHPLTFTLSQKKPLVFTPKAKWLIRLTHLQYFILITVSFFLPYLLPLVTLLVFFPFPLLFLSLLILKPYEIYNRQKTILRIRRQTTNHPHLTIIAITGSFGKTSTKDFLYHILRRHQPTIKTPLSYNTLFGISKVVDLELNNKTKYFICEMGAYKRGEIKELIRMIPPKHSLLTAIGSQHLERFKSLHNTTLAKFELLDAVTPDHALANLDNEPITHQLNLPQYQDVKTYSLKDAAADFYVPSYQLSPLGIIFHLRSKIQNLEFNTPLFGTSNLQNLTAAISMSLLLDIPIPIIKSAVAKLQPSPHRLELKKAGFATLIDDAYSSNEQGFTQIINDLKSLKGKKAVITPGVTELGSESVAIHQQLGQQVANTFDTIYLVGHSNRTQALATGVLAAKPNQQINFLTDHHQLWPTVTQLSQNHDWILLENDLPDNY